MLFNAMKKFGDQISINKALSLINLVADALTITLNLSILGSSRVQVVKLKVKLINKGSTNVLLDTRTLALG